MPVTIEPVEYAGHACIRLANDTVEVLVTTGVGPRVLRYGFLGGRNFFKEMSAAEEAKLTAGASWRIYGGHRVWVGPEERSYTYAPDNAPVEVRQTANSVTATAPIDAVAIGKEIEVALDETGSRVRVTQRLRNHAAWTLRYAVWAISMMAPGGTAVAAFPPRGTHPEILPPSNPLVMWAFTNWTDPRWTLLEKYLLLRQDPERSSPEKAGLFHPNTAAAYLLDGEAFVKTTTATPGRDYPDMGCSLEVFANEMFLEIETLGPIESVAPGDVIEHTEVWSLHRNVNVDALMDVEIDAKVAPLFVRA